MKRLALMALGMAVAAGVAPAVARDLDAPGKPTTSWCERHADAKADYSLGREVGFFIGLGANTEREVLSAYACYDARMPAGERRSELLSAWWDPEYGSAGASCIRQAPAAVASCKRNAVSLPAEGTTPVTHEAEPWWLRLLEVGVDYRYDRGELEAALRAPGRCAAHVCVRPAESRVAADPVVGFRFAGWECRSQGAFACTRTQAGNAAAVGEQGGLLTVVAGDNRVGVPEVCVEPRPDADVRC